MKKLLNRILNALKKRQINETKEQISYWQGRSYVLESICKTAHNSYDRDNLIEANGKWELYKTRLENLTEPSEDVSCSSTWKPIKTAPNSLTQILVTDGSSVWTDQKLGKKGNCIKGDYYFKVHDDWEEVTHWMSIPPYPELS